MPTEEQKQITRLEKEKAGLQSDLGKKAIEVKQLTEQRDTARTHADSMTKLADENARLKNNAELKIVELKNEIKSDMPLAQGAFEVRTKKPIELFGSMKPKGTLIGMITSIEGIEIVSVIDLIKYREASLEMVEAFESCCSPDGSDTIKRLTEQVEELKSKLEGSQADIKVKDEQIGSLTEKLEASVIEIETLNATISQMQQKFDEMSNEISDESKPEDDDKNQLTFDGKDSKTADQKDSNTKTNAQGKGTKQGAGQAKKKS